jgi:hypothetical protein
LLDVTAHLMISYNMKAPPNPFTTPVPVIGARGAAPAGATVGATGEDLEGGIGDAVAVLEFPRFS